MHSQSAKTIWPGRAMAEHDEQAAVINWAQLMAGQYPELDLLYAIPNGAGLRHSVKNGRRYSPEAQKLKAEGMRPGVPDLCLPVARKGWHGLYIEMKYKKNKPSAAQEAYLNRLTEQNYLAVVCWSAEETIETLVDYLTGV